jgi:hypothetical protein
MLKMNKEEFDRLIETSPNIPDKIIEQFKNYFSNQALFDKIIKPEVCDILVPTNQHRNPWFSDENKSRNLNDTIKNELIKQSRIKKQNELNKKIIDDFVTMFINLNNREPIDTEIVDNLKDKIDAEVIKKYIDEYRYVPLRMNTSNDINGINMV